MATMIRCIIAVALPCLGAARQVALNRTEYDAKGFTVVQGFVSDSYADDMVGRMAEMLAEWQPGEETSVFRTTGDTHVSDLYFFESAVDVRYFLEPDAVDEAGGIKEGIQKELAVNKVGHALHVHEKVFEEYAHSGMVFELVRQLGYADPRIPQSMYIFKQPRVGGAVTSHQDATFLWTDPVQSVVGLWLALEDATTENGCLWARPGSHEEDVRRRFRAVYSSRRVKQLKRGEKVAPYMHFENVTDPSTWGWEGSLPDGADPRDAGFVPIPVKKGDLVVIHGKVDHLSMPNRSDKSRQTFQLHLVEGKSVGVHYSRTNWLRYPKGIEFAALDEDPTVRRLRREKLWEALHHEEAEAATARRMRAWIAKKAKDAKDIRKRRKRKGRKAEGGQCEAPGYGPEMLEPARH